jgi:hypothetical protein
MVSLQSPRSFYAFANEYDSHLRETQAPVEVSFDSRYRAGIAHARPLPAHRIKLISVSDLADFYEQ